MAETEIAPAPTDSQLFEKQSGYTGYEADIPIVPSAANEKDETAVIQSKPPGTGPPDGGTAAWLIIFGIGTFQQYYQDTLLRESSPSTISWIPSLQIFFLMGGGPFVGLVYDRYGTRWLLLIGSFMHVLGIMMTSLGTEFYQILLAQGLCSAIGASMVFQPSITAAAGWFHRKRGTAMGIAFTGSSFGAVIIPVMVPKLITEVGFGWAMRICAFLFLFLLTIASLTVRPYLPPQPYKVSTAQLAKPFRETSFLLLVIGFCFFCYGYFAPLNYIPVQAGSDGMSISLQQYLVSILNAGSLFGRVLAGYAGDKIGRFNVFIIVCYLSGIWILALWLPASRNAAIIAFAALFGFFSGAFVSLVTPLVAQISLLPELGFRIGIIMFTGGIAGLTTNPINGAIEESSGGWMGVKIFAGVFCVVGTTLVLLARVKRTGMKFLVRF